VYKSERATIPYPHQIAPVVPELTSDPPTSNLPEPAVPPTAYDADYYRARCAGSYAWSSTGGRRVDGLYYGFLERAQLRAGETVVDVGTGRGDLLVAALELGAARAYGIEYSPAAIELARHTLEVNDRSGRAEVIVGDARALPLADGTADLVCFVDVVEHLTPAELQRALREARRVLRPGGRVVIHTMPNRLIYTVTYAVLRRVAGRHRWRSDPRNDYERLMHVNEHTARSLRRALRAAGFSGHVELGRWVYTDFVPADWAVRVYRALAKLGPLAHLAVADLWAVGRL
jgi:SAM-dependent methyltransferase